MVVGSVFITMLVPKSVEGLFDSERLAFTSAHCISSMRFGGVLTSSADTGVPQSTTAIGLLVSALYQKFRDPYRLITSDQFIEMLAHEDQPPRLSGYTLCTVEDISQYIQVSSYYGDRSLTESYLEVHIETTTGKKLNVTVRKDNVVEEIMMSIQDTAGIPLDQQRLVLVRVLEDGTKKGTLLDSNMRISEYRIRQHDKIILIPAL